MSLSNNNPALFDAYNARFLDPLSIARSFILPQAMFSLLCKNEHSVLIGPRGSGKTTLMKMLRPSSLRVWQHDNKRRILRELKFTAVYVASDSGWNGRMSFVNPESNEHRLYEVLQTSTFVTYLMSSMLDAVLETASINDNDESDLQKFRVRLNSNLEGQLAHELAKRWLLELELPSLRALRLALEDRIRSIDNIYFQVATLKAKIPLAQLVQYPFLSLDVLSVMRAFVTTVNELCDDPTRAWAFCVDEIEILNPSLQQSLFRSLRSSSDQRIRFKLSVSPFSKTFITDVSVPMSGNDFTPINLTYARKHEGVRFSRQMLNALLAEAGIDESPQDIFGKSTFEPTLPQEGRGETPKYSRGGNRYALLRELQSTDSGFANYLIKRDIQLDEVDARSEDERAEIRKLIQIAEIRREFGQTNVLMDRGRNIVRHRSRKRVGDLYTGAESLLTICDGNPRWLIGLFRPLIEEARSRKSVGRSRQARSISTAIARYLSLLSTIPFPHDRNRDIPMTRMLDRIGEYFFADITDPDFKTEPALSFVIDDRVNEQELEAIGAALNQGAFVFIPSQESEHTGGIRNKRFRLSYLLCPRYKLPLMYGQPVILSKILRQRHKDDTSQFTLVDLYR
jgi:hypothetical protein